MAKFNNVILLILTVITFIVTIGIVDAYNTNLVKTNSSLYLGVHIPAADNLSNGSLFLGNYSNSIWNYDTLFLRVPNTTQAINPITTFTNARMNLSGLSHGQCWQEFTNQSTYCGGRETGTYYTADCWGYAGNGLVERFYDGNWGSGAFTCVGSSSNMDVNYTKPAGHVGLPIWSISGSNINGVNNNVANVTILQSCWDLDPNVLQVRGTSWRGGNCGSAQCGNYWSCRNASGWQVLKDARAYNSWIYLYEEAMIWNITTPPSDVNITINNNQLFYAPGNFTNLNNRTNNFASLVQTYLGICDYAEDGYCDVPIQFYSKSIGQIKYEDLTFNVYELFRTIYNTYTSITFTTLVNSTANPVQQVMNTSNNFASLILTAYPEFNVSANVTFYLGEINPTRAFLHPVVYRSNGTVCTSCTNWTRLDGPNVTFYVPDWNTGYYLGELVTLETGLKYYYTFNGHTNDTADNLNLRNSSAISTINYSYGGVGNYRLINLTMGGLTSTLNSNLINGSNTRTINFWASIPNTAVNNYMVSLGTQNVTNGFFGLGILSNQWYIDGNGTGNTYAFGTANTAWNMHTITYNGTTALWYINGALSGTFVHAFNTTIDKLLINDGGISNLSIDELGIWNRALTSTEISSLYSNSYMYAAPDFIKASESDTNVYDQYPILNTWQHRRLIDRLNIEYATSVIYVPNFPGFHPSFNDVRFYDAQTYAPIPYYIEGSNATTVVFRIRNNYQPKVYMYYNGPTYNITSSYLSVYPFNDSIRAAYLFNNNNLNTVLGRGAQNLNPNLNGSFWPGNYYIGYMPNNQEQWTNFSTQNLTSNGIYYNFTISMFLRAVNISAWNTVKPIFQFRHSTANAAFTLFTGPTNNTILSSLTQQGAGAVYSSINNSFGDSQFHQIVVRSYDANNTYWRLELLIDNVSQGILNMTYGENPVRILSMFGNFSGKTANYTYIMDDFLIINQTLTNGEIFYDLGSDEGTVVLVGSEEEIRGLPVENSSDITQIITSASGGVRFNATASDRIELDNITLVIKNQTQIGTRPCYQETATTSYACEGVPSLTGGLYYATGSPSNYQNTYDGDWDTYGSYNTNTGTYYYNYTIPSVAINATWKVRNGYFTSKYDQELFVPEGCFNKSAGMLQLRADSGNSPYMLKYYCYNYTSSSWLFLANQAAPTGDNKNYEEAINWTIPDYALVNQTTIDLTGFVTRSVAIPVTLLDGWYKFFFNVFGHSGLFSTTEETNFTLYAKSVAISLAFLPNETTPPTGWNYSNTVIPFAVNITYDLPDLANVTVIIQNITSIVLNQTSFAPINGINRINLTTPIEGLTYIKATATNPGGVFSQTSTFNFIVDITQPNITAIAPGPLAKTIFNFTANVTDINPITPWVNVSRIKNVTLTVQNSLWNLTGLHYYNLDEGNGTIAFDRGFGANNTNGVISNNSNWFDGKYNNSLLFNGNDSYIEINNIIEPLNESFTISAWIYPTSLDNDHRVIEKGGNSDWRLFISSNEIFFDNPGLGPTSDVESSISLNQWTFVTVTYNGSITKLYRNGILVDSSLPMQYSDVSDIITIGNYGGDKQYGFNGSIDDVRIYDRELSLNEIQQLNNSIAYYRVSIFNYSLITALPTISYTLEDGFYNYTWTATDHANNYYQLDTLQVQVDGTFPNATLLTPLNNSYAHETQNFTAILTDDIGLDNATLIIKNASALESCYQESAIDDPTCRDSFTNGTIAGNATDDIYLNYSIPPRATENSIWQLRRGNQTTPIDMNISLRGLNCLNTSVSDMLQLKIARSGLQYNCWNGTTWRNMTSDTTTGHTIACTIQYNPMTQYKMNDNTTTSTITNTNTTGGNGILDNGLLNRTNQNAVSGKILTAIQFDGVNDNIRNASAINYNYSELAEISVCAWIKPNLLDPARQFIFSSKRDLNQFQCMLVGSNLRCSIYNGTHEFEASTEVTAGTWQHFCYVKSLNNGTIYYNGQDSGEHNEPDAVGTYTGLLIGSDTAYTNPYNGSLDDIRIYPFVIPQWQIDWQMYVGGNGTEVAGYTIGSPIAAYDNNWSSWTFYSNQASTKAWCRTPPISTTTYAYFVYEEAMLWDLDAITNQTTISLGGYGILQAIVGIPVSLVDGIYRWFWSVFDTSGNLDNSDYNYLTMDTTVPTIDYVNPTTTSGMQTALNIEANVTVNDILDAGGLTVILNITGDWPNSTSTIISGSGSFYTNFTNLQDGGYYLQGQVYDGAGNYNETEFRSIIIDNTLPHVDAIYSPQNLSNYANVLFNATVSDENGFLNVSGLENATLYINNIPIATINYTGEHVAEASTTQTLSNGYYNWSWVITDRLNHVYYDTNYTLQVDTTYPNINWISPSNGQIINSDNLTLQLNASANTVSVTYYIYNDTFLNITTRPAISGVNIITYTLSDGYYHFNASAVNGELQNWTDDRIILLDATPPSATIPGFNYSNISIVNFTINNIQDNFGLVNLTYTINNYSRNYTFPLNTTYGGNLSYSDNLKNGNYSWALLISDIATNYRNYNGTLMVNTSLPILTYHYPHFHSPESIVYVRDTPLTVILIFNSTSNNMTNGTFYLEGAQPGINGTYFYNINSDNVVMNYSNLSTDGTYIYHAEVTDTANNIYTVSNHTFIIDTELPYIEFLSPLIYYNNTSMTIPITIYSEVSNVNSTTYLIYNETWSNSTTFSLVGYPYNFTHQLNFTFPSQGRFTINVSVDDLAGNKNTITQIFYDDLTNPNITNTNPLTSYVNSSSNNFTADSTDNAAIRNISLNISGNNGYSNLTTINYAYGVAQTTVGVVVALTDGIYNWFFTAYDWANNLFSSSTQQTTVDTTNPSISFTGPTPVNGYNVSSLNISVVILLNETNPTNITYNIWNSTWVNSVTYPPVNLSNIFVVPAEGRYYYNVTTLDAVNHYNSTEVRTVTFDITKPLFTLIDPESTALKYYNSSTITFRAILFDGEGQVSGIKNATINIGGNDYITNFSGNNTENLNQPITLSDGDYPWILTIYDFAGNNNQTTGNITIEAATPQISFVSPTYQNYINISNQTIPVFVAAGTTNFANITYRIWNNTWYNYTTYNTRIYNTTFIVTGQNLYYYNVSIYNLAGSSNTTETRQVFVDTINPTITLITPNLTDYQYGLPPTNLTYSSTSIYNYSMQLSDDSSGIGLDTSRFVLNNTLYTTNYNTGTYNTILSNIISLTDGLYNWSINVSDRVNNYASTLSGAIEIDTTTPGIVFNNSLVQPTGVNISSRNITLAVRIIESNPYSITYNVWNSTWNNITTISLAAQQVNGLYQPFSPGSSFVNSIIITVPADGLYYYNATTLDILNRTNATETRTITLDITAPNATLISPIDDLHSQSDQNFTVNLTDNIGIKNATLYLFGFNNLTTNISTVYFIPNTVQSLLGIVYPLADDIYLWWYTVFDWSGNSYTTENRTFSKDTTWPQIYFDPVYNLPDGANVSQDYVDVRVVIIEQHLDSVNFTIFNDTWSNTTNYNFTTFNNQQIFSNLAEGTYRYYVNTTDAVGHENSTSIYAVTLDTHAPNATILAINNNTNGTILNFTYYTSPNQTFILNTSDNIALKNTTLILNGTLTNGTGYYNETTVNLGAAIQAVVSIPTVLSDGIYNWFWKVYDYANNLFTTSSQQTVISATGPAITINYPPANNLSVAYNWQSVLVNYTLVSANPKNSSLTLVGPNGYSNTSSYSYPPNLNGTTLILSEQYNFTGLLDGIYNITVMAYDYLDNPNTATRTIYITGNAPVMNYVSPTILTGATYENFIDVNLTATDLTPNRIDTFLYRQNGSNLTIVSNYSVTSAQASYKRFTGLSNGNYYFNATAYDTFNNTATLLSTLIIVEAGATNTTFCKPLLVAGNYVLTQNVNTSTGVCFTVTQPNTIIDCRGYTISAPNGTGIITGQSATIRNCVINSLTNGINITGGTVSLTNVTTVTTGAGIRITNGASVTATGCSIDGLYGVYLGAGSLTMSGSNIHDNTYGLYVTGSSTATLSYVNFTDNTYAIYHNVTTTFPGGSSGAMVWGPSGAGRYTNLRFTGTTTDIITLLYSNYNTFTTLTSTTAGEVRYTNSSNNNVNSGTLGTGGVILASSSRNNRFLDTTYSGTETVDSTSQLIRAWTTTVTTVDNQGDNVGGSTVHINDGSNKTVYTNPQGVVVTDVNEYINNGTVTIFNPYEIFGVYTDYGNSIFTDSPSVTVNSPTDVTLTFNKEIRSTLLTRQVALILMAMILLIGLAASTGFFIVKMRNGESVADIWKYFIIMIIWDTIFLVIFLVLSKYTMQFFYPG